MLVSPVRSSVPIELTNIESIRSQINNQNQLRKSQESTTKIKTTSLPCLPAALLPPPCCPSTAYGSCRASWRWSSSGRPHQICHLLEPLPRAVARVACLQPGEERRCYRLPTPVRQRSLPYAEEEPRVASSSWGARAK